MVNNKEPKGEQNMQIVLGYERINKYNRVVDMVVKKEDGEYKVVQPIKPKGGINLANVQFIAFNDYREGDSEEELKVRPIVINSEGREYLAMNISQAKPHTIFRYFDLDNNGEYYLIRVHMEEKVVGVTRSDEVPKLYRNEEGHLDLEEPRDIEQIEKKVNIVTLTSIEGDWLPKLWEEIKEQLNGDLIHEIIKETGNREIALAVSTPVLKQIRENNKYK